MPDFGPDRAVRLPDTTQVDRVARNQAGVIADDPGCGPQLLDDKAVGQELSDMGVMGNLDNLVCAVKVPLVTGLYLQLCRVQVAVGQQTK